MELTDLKKDWNQVLFALEARNRVAWLTFFDARLAKLEGAKLFLDFSDPEKLAGDHSYAQARAKFVALLQEVIVEVTGQHFEVHW